MMNGMEKTSEDQSRLDEVNEHILKEYSEEIASLLSDECLMDRYMKCSSVKKNIDILRQILIKEEICKKTQETIISAYILKLIPPGTKGVIRGIKFNELVQSKIETYLLPCERFDVCFETQHPIYKTDETPDWYIYDKKQDKILIGMNQLDLWGGGQQLNRGYHYLVQNKHNSMNSKLLCVVANMYQINKVKSKIFKLFDLGFRNKTLCYINGLEAIIMDYFDLS
jgi:hypothetical protein